MIYCSSVRRVSVSSCNSYTCLDYTRSSHICQAFSTGGQAEQEIEESEQAFSLPPPPPATRPSPGHPPVPRRPARGGPTIYDRATSATNASYIVGPPLAGRLGCLLAWDVCWPGVACSLGCLLAWGGVWPGMSAGLGCLLAWDVC